MENHEHEWALTILKTPGQIRWFRYPQGEGEGHTLISCKCGAWSVTEFSSDKNKKRGPCGHVINVQGASSNGYTLPKRETASLGWDELTPEEQQEREDLNLRLIEERKMARD